MISLVTSFTIPASNNDKVCKICHSKLSNNTELGNNCESESNSTAICIAGWILGPALQGLPAGILGRGKK